MMHSAQIKLGIHTDNIIPDISTAVIITSITYQIIASLISKKRPFSYYTQDPHDPALTIDSPYLNSCYISNGATGFFKLNNLQAEVMLATAPNIGTPGYPLKRSKGVKHLVHIWHSLGDYAYAWYHKGGLDHYDEVLTAGLHMHPQIRLIEQKRNLSPKS